MLQIWIKKLSECAISDAHNFTTFLRKLGSATCVAGSSVFRGIPSAFSTIYRDSLTLLFVDNNNNRRSRFWFKWEVNNSFKGIEYNQYRSHKFCGLYFRYSALIVFEMKLSSPDISVFLIIRLSSVFVVQTWFVPDEYWQSLEVAHKLTFDFGYLTWEWYEGIRSLLYPLVLSVLYKLLAYFYLDSSITLVRNKTCVLEIFIFRFFPIFQGFSAKNSSSTDLCLVRMDFHKRNRKNTESSSNFMVHFTSVGNIFQLLCRIPNYS